MYARLDDNVVNKEPQALEFPKLTFSSAAVIGSSLSTDNMMKPASGSISLMAYISFHWTAVYLADYASKVSVYAVICW